MPARRVTIAPRALTAAALLAALAPGCSGAPPTAVAPVSQLCAPGALDACERKIAAAPAGPASRALVSAYVDARAARDPNDRWATLFRELDAADRGPRPKAVLLLEVGTDAGQWNVSVKGSLTITATAPGAPTTRGVRGVLGGALPAPGAIDVDELLLAMAAATGYEHVVRLGEKDVTELFPADPLAPFVGGLRPVLRVSDTPGKPVSELDAEEALRAAFEAAAAFRYVDAARAADYDATNNAFTERAMMKKALARVRPAAVAGWPGSYSFDRATGELSLTFQSDPAVTAPHLIAVASALGAPLSVTCDGAAVKTSAYDGFGTLAVQCGQGDGVKHTLGVKVAPLP
jgi:hypothetical protein